MVGMALDTNGQKGRFVDAARKFGNDPSVISALIAGNDDLAGVAGRYAIAADKLEAGLAIRSAHKASAYFEFVHDIRWHRGNEAEVRALADAADLIHLTNDFKAYFWLRQHKPRKPALIHHHGTLFRNNPERMLSEARRFGMVQAVSTIDLKRPAPDALHWLPTAYDLDELARLREEHRRPEDGRIVVAHAPTNREIKSTDAFEAAIRTLQAEGLPVDALIIANKTHAECLRLKATADIYFDQVKLGYGCNAIEAWGMGIPVIAGADDWTLEAMSKEFDQSGIGIGGPLPFHVATEDTIAARIYELVFDKRLRRSVAHVGKAHAKRFHAELPALRRLAEVYGIVLGTNASLPPVQTEAEEFPAKPGTFRSEHPRVSVRVANQVYRFVDGEPVTISDPRMAQRMRQVARYSPSYRVSEVYP
jgi:hypothetical protein